jgi:hypothetical protein
LSDSNINSNFTSYLLEQNSSIFLFRSSLSSLYFYFSCSTYWICFAFLF